VYQLPYPWGLTEHGDGAVVVAMVAVRMVQAPVDQVIIVVAVWYALVPAAIVPALAGNRVAAGGVLGTDGNHMLIVVAVVRVMQMPIVQIVHVITVLDAGMTTVVAMHMRVRFMFCTCHCHRSFHDVDEPQVHCLRRNASIIVQCSVLGKWRVSCPVMLFSR